MRRTIVTGVVLGVVLAAGGALAGTVSVSYPSEDSAKACGGAPAVPLGPGGGGDCFEAGDELVETFAGVIPAGTYFTRSRFQFTMDDFTDPTVVNTFDVEINGVLVGSYSSIGNDGNPQGRSFDLTFEHAPIQGPDVTLRFLATSTVPPGLSSWGWIAGGTVTFTPVTDDFTCYGGKDLKDPKFTRIDGVGLEDALGANTASLKKPSLVCLPTSRDGGGTLQSIGLCCYAAKAAKLAEKTALSVEDAFGSLQVQVKKPSLVCVPCRAATTS